MKRAFFLVLATVMLLCCVTPPISAAPEIDVDAYLSDAGYPQELIARMDDEGRAPSLSYPHKEVSFLPR